MGIIVDVSHFYKRRDARLDSRGKPKAKKQFNMDFEVGVYPADEPGDKGGGKGGNTRLPFGLCKAAGIDTTGMTPSEAWAALAGDTGVTAKKAYAELEKKGEAKSLAKEVKEKATEKSEEPEEEDIVPDISVKRKEAASRFKAAVDMATDRETVMKILEGVPTGGVVHYTPIDKHGKVTDKDATAKRNADGSWTTDIGTEVSTSRLSWWVNRDRKRGKPFALESDDFTMPTDGEKSFAPEKPAKTVEPPKEAEPEKAVTTEKGTHYIIPAAPAITGTKIAVKTTPEIDTSKVKTMMNADATRDKWSATHKQYDKYKDDVTAGMKYLFDTNEFCMNISPYIVQSIIEKGFLNQFQTKKDPAISHKTSGASNLPLRKKASQNMFGTPDKTPYADYEKYGYLGNPLKPSTESKGFASGYGSATVIFKRDRVKNRITYSVTDSLGLGASGAAVPGKDGDNTSYEGVGFEGMDHWSGTPSTTMRAIMDAPKKKSGLEDIIGYGYLELQYHGPLTMSDAEAIVFRSEYAYKSSVTPDVKEALDALGVKVIKLWEK